MVALQATAAVSRGGVAPDMLVMRLCLAWPVATTCAGPGMCEPCCPHPSAPPVYSMSPAMVHLLQGPHGGTAVQTATRTTEPMTPALQRLILQALRAEGQRRNYTDLATVRE